MTREDENLVRHEILREVELRVKDRELDGEIISKDIVLEILKELE